MKTTKGERFKKFLEDCNISATELAKAVSVTRQSIYNYQKDSVLPLKVQQYLKENHGLNLDWYNHEQGEMLLFSSVNNEAIHIPNNQRLTILLAEAYNALPDNKKYIIAEIKKEYLLKGGIENDNEALELLREIKDRVSRNV